MREGWKEVSIGEIVELGKGGSWGEDDPAEGLVQAICLRGTDLAELIDRKLPQAPVRWIKESELKKSRCSKDMVLIETSGSKCGRSIVLTEHILKKFDLPVIYSNFCRTLSIDTSKVTREFVEVWFSHNYANGLIPSYRATSAMPNLDVKSLLRVELIKVPPFSEQKRIIDLISSVDSFIECTKELVDKSQAIRASVAESLWLTFKLRSKLSSFGEILTGSTPPTKVANFWDNHDVDFFTPGDMGVSLKLHKASRGVSSQGAAVSRQLKGNSVLQVCIGATIGKVGFLNFSAVTNQQINALTDLTEHDAPILATILSSETFQSIIKNKAGGSTLPIISKSSWSDIEVPYVPENERAKVSKVIIELEFFIEQSKQILLSAYKLRTSVLDSLLSGNHEIPTTYDKLVGAA